MDPSIVTPPVKEYENIEIQDASDPRDSTGTLVVDSVSPPFSKVSSDSAEIAETRRGGDCVGTGLPSTYRLLKREAMPDWYQHEKFIWSGYRPINPSIKACILSLFTHVHNETGNIWTHLIGSILVIALTGYTWGYLFWKQGLVGVDWRDHLIAAELHLSVISCFTFSTLFHTMCCHSQTVHRSCLKADYVGIVFHIGGCFLASVYYLFYCNETLRIVYMSLIFGTGLATVTNLSKRFLKREYAKLRLGLFIAFGMIGIVPIAHACVLYGFPFTQRAIGLNYIFLVALSNLGGSMIFNFRIPERFAPGAFDYWGQSHQIMHVCIVMGAISHYLGFIQAFQFWHFRNGDCVIPLIEMDLQAASSSGW